ncbi:MAG: hypothetical protein AAF585_09540 [Verrucomicrobiota bacterium]
MTDISFDHLKRVKPASVHKLDHAVTMVQSSPNLQHMAAWSGKGEVTIVSNGQISNRLSLGEVGGMEMSVDNSAQQLAHVLPESSHAVILDVNTGDRALIDVGFGSKVEACRFDSKGRIWITRAIEDHFVIELRTPPDWALQASAPFSGDGFSGAGSITWPGSADYVLAQIYSGQSENETFVCEWNGAEQIAVRRVDAISETENFPLVSPLGSEAISIDHTSMQLSRIAWPYEEIIEQVPWPDFDEEEAEDERPGFAACFLDDVNAMLSSYEGRLFVLHTRSMRFADEISVAGFEPFPGSQKYPTLSDVENLVVSNLLNIGRCGDFVAAFFGPDYRTTSPQMALIPIRTFLG